VGWRVGGGKKLSMSVFSLLPGSGGGEMRLKYLFILSSWRDGSRMKVKKVGVSVNPASNLGVWRQN
jgi:hypothetical protein